MSRLYLNKSALNDLLAWDEAASKPSTVTIMQINIKEVYPGQQIRKPQVPNKMAQSDPKWGLKVAWSSADLLERQASLETYSVEVAMLFEAVRTVATRAVNRVLSIGDLEFAANFGSPIEGNKQRISIRLTKPIELAIMLHRELIDGKLKWSAEVGYSANTPLISADRLIDTQRAGGELPMDPVSVTRGEVAEAEEVARKEKSRRKVTL